MDGVFYLWQSPNMATRDETVADVTVQTKITKADSDRLDVEIERLKVLVPTGEFTRSSVMRSALLEWLLEVEAAPPGKLPKARRSA